VRKYVAVLDNPAASWWKTKYLALFALALAVWLIPAAASAAAPNWDISGRWAGYSGDLALTQTNSSLSGTFQMEAGCTESYTVSGSISGSDVTLALRRANGGGDAMPCAGSQTLQGVVDPTGTAMSLTLANFAFSSPPDRFTGTARAVAPTTTTTARTSSTTTSRPTTTIPATNSSYTVLVKCSGRTQRCSNSFTTTVQTHKGTLVAHFTTASGHCSDARITISVDEKSPHTSAFIGRNTSTPAFSFAVTAGRHQVRVGAEGRVGGCNKGFLAQWGGTLHVRASE
jgi:hypothetical protein